MSVTVRVFCSCAWLLPLPLRAVAAAVQGMLAAVEAEDIAVELHIVRDGRMAAENSAYMGCRGPTNVLSFPAQITETGVFPTSSTETMLPGILLLSADTLRRECLLYGQNTTEHCLRLLAHGLGHLLGHDHGPIMDALCHELWLAGCEVCSNGCGMNRRAKSHDNQSVNPKLCLGTPKV